MADLQRGLDAAQRSQRSSAPTGQVTAYALATAPDGWQMCDGTLAKSKALLDALDAAGRPYGGSAGAGLVPDLQGRVIVGKGTNAEVSSLANNDALAVASRKVKHSHGRGTLAVSSDSSTLPSGFGGTIGGPIDNNDRPALTNAGFANRVTSGNVFPHSHGLTGTIGDTAGPLDAPAYQVLNYIVKL